VLALNAYVNEEGTEVTFVHVHPDAASMEVHETAAHEHTDDSTSCGCNIGQWADSKDCP
jgi:hypothetical protein